MKKRVILLVISLILFIPFVLATIDVTYNTDPNTNVIYEGYSCNNNDCNNVNNLQNFLTKTGTGTSIIVQYPLEEAYNNYFYKDCFYPRQTTVDITSAFNSLIISAPLSKKSACQASISSVNIVGDQKVGSTLTISATVQSPFQKGTNAPTNFVPQTRQDYYKADTKIDLLIDGNVKQTINKNLLISTSETVQFNWLLTQSDLGTHIIKVKSNVFDCQCQQPQTDYLSSEANINIQTTQAATCSSDSQCKTGCSTGDPDCTCLQQTGDLCTATETCSGTSLQHSGIGTCCSVTCTISASTPCTLSDWSCTTWSTCTNSQQTRTCTKTSCTGDTGKPAETQSCSVESCSQTTPTCPPNAAEKCGTGHPRCSCSTLGGYLCKEGELCITSLTHEDQGTCCSTLCIPPREPCVEGQLPQVCVPDSFGCIMIRKCENKEWSQCIRADSSCTGSSDCRDGTKGGKCSEINPGKACINGNLEQYEWCMIPSNQTCKELWDCPSFIIIEDHQICNQWIDMHNCETYNLMPRENQTFSLDYITPYKQSSEYIESTLSAPSIITEGQAPQPEENKETVITQILDKLGIPFPKNLSVKVGFEYPIVLFVIAAVIAAFALYLFNHNPLEKIKVPQPKISQKTKSPVKPTDLLISVIDSLKGDERKLADKLLEDEGITVEEMRKKLGFTKTKMDIALTKLERRQLLKERKDYNDGLYFNDWLK